MCDYNKIFKEIAICRNTEAEAKARREELEAQIKAYMLAEDLTELIGEEHRALYTEVVSNKFDTTKFKKKLPELAKQFMKTTSYMRFDFK